MVTEKNKHGLSRYIDAQTRREIRQACGYGCVICGDAIYTYEHIDPKFSEATEHNPQKMTLLCSGCHGKVTNGFWSKQKVLEARKNPFCKSVGRSHFQLDIAKDDEYTVSIGNTGFVNLRSIIEIDNVNILSVFPPEDTNAPPRISAKFFNRDNAEIASIVQNQWYGNVDAFDIEAKGGTFKIRSGLNNIDLLIKVQPPNLLSIEQIELAYNKTRISGSTTKGFKVSLQDTSVKIPPKPDEICEAPFWLSIKNEKIYIGSDNVGSLNGVEHSGFYEIENAEVELVDPIDIQSPIGPSPGRKALRIKGSEGGGIVNFNLETPKRIFSKQEIHTDFDEKVPRNDPCPCGSGKKYKKCHGDPKRMPSKH